MSAEPNLIVIQVPMVSSIRIKAMSAAAQYAHTWSLYVSLLIWMKMRPFSAMTTSYCFFILEIPWDEMMVATSGSVFFNLLICLDPVVVVLLLHWFLRDTWWREGERWGSARLRFIMDHTRAGPIMLYPYCSMESSFDCNVRPLRLSSEWAYFPTSLSCLANIALAIVRSSFVWPLERSVSTKSWFTISVNESWSICTVLRASSPQAQCHQEDSQSVILLAVDQA